MSLNAGDCWVYCWGVFPLSGTFSVFASFFLCCYGCSVTSFLVDGLIGTLKLAVLPMNDCLWLTVIMHHIPIARDVLKHLSCIWDNIPYCILWWLCGVSSEWLLKESNINGLFLLWEKLQFLHGIRVLVDIIDSWFAMGYLIIGAFLRFLTEIFLSPLLVYFPFYSILHHGDKDHNLVDYKLHPSNYVMWAWILKHHIQEGLVGPWGWWKVNPGLQLNSKVWKILRRLMDLVGPKPWRNMRKRLMISM